MNTRLFALVLPLSVAACGGAAPPGGAAAPTPAADPEQACQAGDGAACARAGAALERGDSPNLPAAAQRYERGCTLQNGTACAGLGSLYQMGKGIPADPAKARALQQKACDLGEGEGCMTLARELNVRLAMPTPEQMENPVSEEEHEKQLVRVHDLVKRACSLKVEDACEGLKTQKDEILHLVWQFPEGKP